MLAQYGDDIRKICGTVDVKDNDIVDSQNLNEVYNYRVDYLILEDKKVHKKALLLRVSDKVFMINSFLRKVTAGYSDLVDYIVLAVKKLYFGDRKMAHAIKITTRYTTSLDIRDDFNTVPPQSYKYL